MLSITVNDQQVSFFNLRHVTCSKSSFRSKTSSKAQHRQQPQTTQRNALYLPIEHLEVAELLVDELVHGDFEGVAHLGDEVERRRVPRLHELSAECKER